MKEKTQKIVVDGKEIDVLIDTDLEEIDDALEKEEEDTIDLKEILEQTQKIEIGLNHE